MSTLTGQDERTRAAILTVDDDPAVSRAVARDLRRKYGDQYRIVRAESPSAGLEALRQMKLRGDLVAAILADYRMPRAERHRVPRAGDGHLSRCAAGAADRVRRHRGRDRRDQRRRS